MKFAIMCNVTFQTEVYVEAENLPAAMARIAQHDFDSAEYDSVEPTLEPLTWVKPQVWDADEGDFVPSNVYLFPVRDEVEDEEGFNFEPTG